MLEENVLVTMVRENLEDIPLFSLPSAYSMRSFHSGDELVWREIQLAADRYNTITPELFFREFGDDQRTLAQRQFYLCDSSQTAIGTATAWSDNDFQGLPYGRVHWVAIVPEFQGRGLAKPLMTAVCQRLRDLGHERAYLTTSSARLTAIGLYLLFGIAPQYQNDAERIVWKQVIDRIRKHPHAT